MALQIWLPTRSGAPITACSFDWCKLFTRLPSRLGLRLGEDARREYPKLRDVPRITGTRRTHFTDTCLLALGSWTCGQSAAGASEAKQK